MVAFNSGSVGKTMMQSRSEATRHFIGVSSFQALVFFRRGLFYAYLSVYLRFYLGLTVTETTLFATLPMIINVMAQAFIWGPLSDRRQIRRTLIWWGEVLGGIGTLGVWYAHTLAITPRVSGFVVIAGLTVVELFWSMSNVGWSALISDIYPAEKRNAIQGRLASMGGLGRMAGIWSGGLLYDGFGRQFEGWGFAAGPLFWVAAAVMVASVLPLKLLPEGGIDTRSEDKKEDQHLEAPILKIFTLFIIAMVFIDFGRNAIVLVLSQYMMLESGFGISSLMLGHFFNVQSVAIIVAGLLVGVLGQKIGERKLLVLGVVNVLVFLTIMATTDSLGVMFGANILRGFSDVVITSTAYAFAANLIPSGMRGKLFSYFNATLFLSWGLAGTLVAGPIVDLLLNQGADEVFAYRMAFVGAIVLTVIGLMILLSLFMMLKRESRNGNGYV